MTVNDRQWLSMTVNDRQWLSMAVNDCQWLSMTVLVSFCRSVLPEFLRSFFSLVSRHILLSTISRHFSISPFLTLLVFSYFRHITNTGLWMTWMQNRHITNTLLYVQMITWFRNIWLQPLAQTLEKLLFQFVSSSCKIAPDDGMCISFLKSCAQYSSSIQSFGKSAADIFWAKTTLAALLLSTPFFVTSLIKLYSMLNDKKY